jgi:alkylation response protein AidB-like acyl-CoA dehydrogenase
MNRHSRICLADALEYAHDRTTWGKPLIDNQIIVHKFITMARHVESHWAWIEQIAYDMKVNGGNSDHLVRINPPLSASLIPHWTGL